MAGRGAGAAAGAAVESTVESTGAAVVVAVAGCPADVDDDLGPVGGLAGGTGLAEAEVHMVLVAVGDSGAGVVAPSGRGCVGAPDVLVPDDVHDPEPASHRVLVAVGVGGEQPVEQRLDLRDLVRVLVADRPVPRAAFLVLAGAADLAAAHDAVVAGARVGLEDQRPELDHTGLRHGVALRLRLVGREVLDRRAE